MTEKNSSDPTSDHNHDKELSERRIEGNSPIPRFNLRDKILIIIGISALGIYLIIALSQFFGKVLQ